MTEEELNARFAQMADAVGRVANAQLRFQEQLGDLAGVVRQVIARQDRHEQEMEEFRRRQEESDRRFERLQQQQAETDQRFNVLLQEIRFLVRQQQQPPQNEESEQ